MSNKPQNIKKQQIKDTVSGYIKTNCIHKKIPNDIKFIILMYYWIKSILVYVIGNGEYGQLGLGDDDDVDELTPQTHKYQIQHIYKGRNHCIYSDFDNNHYCTGENKNGQCCLGDDPDCDYEVKILTKITSFINNNIKIKQIFINITSDHMFWMDVNQNIYGNGFNRCHQLGLKNDSKYEDKPMHIKYLKNIKDIQCSEWYSLALDNNNNVYSTGLGDYGELGHGIHTTKKERFTMIKALNNCNIIKIKTGQYYSFFLSSNYILYGCGANESGQLGLGHLNNQFIPVINDYFNKNEIKIIDISCGWDHNLCVDINNKIYSFGDNAYGQCGLGLNDDKILIPQQINMLENEKIVSIKCGSNHSYCLSSSNNHYLWGTNTYNECIINNKMDKIISPHLVNDIIKKAVNNKTIKEIFLGDDNTQIIVTD